MLASITPLGERGRGASWRRTVTAYVGASTAGGVVLGAALGTLGSLAGTSPPSWLLLLVAVAAVAAAALDVSGRLPSIHRQVDEGWLTRYRDWVYGAGFGFQLGLAAVTIVTSASVYLMWLLELLTTSPLEGALVGAVFGAARAVPLVTTRRIIDAESLRAAHRGWEQRLVVVRRLTVAVEIAAGIALAAVAA
jgi:hypothetical protein